MVKLLGDNIFGDIVGNLLYQVFIKWNVPIDYNKIFMSIFATSNFLEYLKISYV